MQTDLIETYARVPEAPGVYIMKDEAGKIIYIGKARNLKKRLAAYFSGPGRLDRKTAALVGRIASLETLLTDTEKEALILESNLIKRHRPRYNVILKDDKRYPSLRLDIHKPYPTISIVRKTPPDGSMYFGPFTSALSVRRTLRFIHKTFKLRKCNERNFQSRSRPCLNFQMGLCLGPCCNDVDPDRYRRIVDEVILFLRGRTPELIRRVRDEMNAAAAAQAFESAALLRDKMFSLEKTLEKQVVVNTDFQDRDIFAVASEEGLGLAALVRIRGGFLVATRFFEFRDTFSTPAELLGTCIRQYYETAPEVPAEILLQFLPEDADLLAETLREARGRSLRIYRPQRGEKYRLLQMAVQNVDKEMTERRFALEKEQDMLARLRKRLQLTRLPHRIECYDNSNLQGSQPVAAMVVFLNGRPERSAYRKFIIGTVAGPDDYASMEEVLKRRFSGSLADEAPPDLLMVDGGRGQLGIAGNVVADLGLSGRFGIVAIAKKDERKGEGRDKVFLPGRANPVSFGKDADLLLFLQKIRDETHRFAIGFHRHRREKDSLRSVLDEIPGVGPDRKRALLDRFGSIAEIRAALPDALEAVPGISPALAASIRDALGEGGPADGG